MNKIQIITKLIKSGVKVLQAIQTEKFLNKKFR